jgi:hypothetical protein
VDLHDGEYILSNIRRAGVSEESQICQTELFSWDTYILRVEFHYDNVQDRGHLSTEARVRSLGTTTWLHGGEFYEKLIVAQPVD